MDYDEIVKLLLEHAKDKNPAVNPLHLAERHGHIEIVDLIKYFSKD
jgi:ankyrin repeat protein